VERIAANRCVPAETLPLEATRTQWIRPGRIHRRKGPPGIATARVKVTGWQVSVTEGLWRCGVDRPSAPRFPLVVAHAPKLLEGFSPRLMNNFGPTIRVRRDCEGPQSQACCHASGTQRKPPPSRHVQFPGTADGGARTKKGIRFV
jgi:hypothetical protein